MERCIMLLVIELDNTCIMFPAVGCFTCLLQFTMCPFVNTHVLQCEFAHTNAPLNFLDSR